MRKGMRSKSEVSRSQDYCEEQVEYEERTRGEVLYGDD